MGKIRSLYVRPLYSSDVAFDTPGVLELRSAKVGDPVNAFDFQAAVASRLTAATTSDNVTILVGTGALASLRTRIAAAALDQMVAKRQLSYLNRYKHKADILGAYNAVYTAGAAGKVGRLNRLTLLEQQRAAAVDTAFTSGNLSGVITSADTSMVNYGGAQTANTFINGLGMRQPTHTVTVTGPPNATNTVNDTDSLPLKWTGSVWTPVQETQPNYNSQKTETTLPTQTVTTKFTDLRDLAAENQMRTETTQLDLQDQLLSQSVVNAQVPDLGDILDGELQVIDGEVRKAQLAFAFLYLTAPIAGVVTAVFKDVGELVAVGEPVMRIEGQDDILLVGLIQYRAPLTIGTPVTVTATEVFEDGGKASLAGRVVAVRGHDANNDEWDVMIQARNTGTPVTMPDATVRNVVFPLNYHFDRETTTVTI